MQYMEYFLRRLDPRTKILLAPMFSIIVFIIDQLPAAACLLICFLVLRTALKMPFGNIKTYFRILSAIIVFIILLQMLFGPGERYIIRPFKYDGLILGLVIGCRLTALMLILPILIMTTEPYLIVQGLTRLGLNYRASYLITAALNLVPVFKEEAHSIMDSQKLRGMRTFDKGSFLDKFIVYKALAVPLVLGAMRRAQFTGIAMDARAFGAYKTRSWLSQIKIKRQDYLSFSASVVFAALMLAFNFILK